MRSLARSAKVPRSGFAALMHCWSYITIYVLTVQREILCLHVCNGHIILN